MLGGGWRWVGHVLGWIEVGGSCLKVRGDGWRWLSHVLRWVEVGWSCFEVAGSYFEVGGGEWVIF